LVRSTLIVRPVACCDLTHPRCPYSLGVRRDYDVLPPKVLEDLLSRLGGYVFDEGVITCPNPLLHPKAEAVAAAVRKHVGRLTLMTPVTGLSKLGRGLLEALDELVVVSASAEELAREEGVIKGLMSQGVDRLSIYAAVSREGEVVRSVLEHLRFCRRYGIQLRVGELPYVSKVPLRLRDRLIEEGFEVSIPYGVRYGYVASVAFITDYRVTVLERPESRPCRSLYVDFEGRVRKCPFTSGGLDASEAGTEELRRLIYSQCPASPNPLEYVPEVRISLRAGAGVQIPPDVLALLEVIESTNSLRAACRLLGYNPSTYAEKLRSIERRLGVKLVTSRRGGSLKGVTLLTSEGLKILTAYRRVREVVMSALLKEGIQYFTFEA